MRLLYITNGIDGSGGLERVLSIKASYFADYLGYEVFILTLNSLNGPLFYDFSSKIIVLNNVVDGNPLQYLCKYVKGIRSIVDAVKPDIISVCDDGLKGFFIPRILNTKTPVIYERHASIQLNRKNGIKGTIINFLMQRNAGKFDRFVVLTNANRKEWSLQNTVVIPNALSFYPKESGRLLNKEIIVVGSHSYNKGYDLLLQVWKEVCAYYPDWQLNIYGKIDPNQTYINLAKDLGIESSVSFRDPVLNIEDKYLDSSILLMTSRSEGFGMVLIEAMACGLPCVSFDCPSGPRDIITDKEDGFLVRPEDVEQMVEKVIFLIKNEDIRTQMGIKAKVNVKRFMLENVIGQWVNLFKELTT